MVDKQVVLETIKKMYDSGIDDSVVQQTLQDIGLSENEIRQYIAEVKGQPLKPEARPEPKPLEKRMPQKEEAVESQEAMHTTTHAALAAQASQTNDLLDKITSMESALKSLSKASAGQENLAGINQRLGTAEKQLHDLKAQLDATKGIMEKILETDRKILNRL
jgi:hypothetical protein